MPTPAPHRTASGIAYWTLGSGPPLICVHGGPGMNHAFFRPALDALATGRTVVYLDLPGHGESAAPPDYALETMAAAIDDVRADLNADRIALLGNSYGGFLSLIYARDEPARVTALVLVDTSASYGFRDESLRTAQQRGTPEILAALDRLWDGSLHTDADFHAAWRTIFPLYFHRLPVADIHALADTATYRLDTRKAVLPTLRDYDIRADLPRITAPALILAGRHDWITSVAQAEHLAAGLPHSDLRILDDSGHYPFLDQPGETIGAIDAWLRDHDA